MIEPDDEEIDDITLPLMMAPERLSPLERAAFLLHDVFGVGFEEIAETIGRTPEACRQLASRARENAREAAPLRLADGARPGDRGGFLHRLTKRRRRGLAQLLAADVAIYTDGGGKRPAIPVPIIGLENTLPFFCKARAVPG